MKKVLIIANLFHASPRIPGLVKYLPEFGWQPIILTTPIGENPDARFGPPNNFKDSNRVIETYHYNPEEDIGVRVNKRFNLASKKSYNYVKPFLWFLYKFYLEVTDYPDREKGWKPFAVDAGSKLLQSEHVDAMISSSSPVTSHLVAKELKAKYKIPWIADLRDLWSQNHCYSYGPLRKAIDRRLELKTILSANILTTVSQPWAEKLRTLHKRKSVYAITHGFDPVTVNIPPANLTAKFTITYTGSIYTRKQDPAKLFTALRELISERAIDPDDIEVRLYGTGVEWLEKEIEQYGLSNIVKHYQKVPRDVALEKQKESQLLVHFRWEDPQELGAYSGKIFEYLGARRPILATGGFAGDVVEELLNETGAGICASSVEDVKNTLRELYREYKLKGEISYKGEESEVDKYTHREMAKKFSEILDHLRREQHERLMDL